MITQLKLEFLKLIRARSFVLSFIALTIFVALMLWGFYTHAQRKAGEQATAQFKYTYESKSYFNGLTFALYSVMFSFSLLIPIFVAMIAGAQIAGERQSGTLRMICVRPVSRVSLLLSKFVVVGFYTYLLVAFFMGLNLLVGLFFVGWGDLQLYPGALNLVDEPGKLMRDEALLRFASTAISILFLGERALVILTHCLFWPENSAFLAGKQTDTISCTSLNLFTIIKNGRGNRMRRTERQKGGEALGGQPRTLLKAYEFPISISNQQRLVRRHAPSEHFQSSGTTPNIQ